MNWSNWYYYSKLHCSLSLNLHIHLISQSYIGVQCLMHHFKWDYPLFILLLKTGFFYLPQVHQYQVLSGSQFQDVIQVLVREPWAQLCLIYIHRREKLLTKIRVSKYAQHVCSKRCQVRLAWQKMLRKCVQASCGKFALQIRVTLQVYYFKLNVDGRIRGIQGNGQQNTLKSFSSSPKIWTHCSNSRNSPIILSLNLFMSAAYWVAHTSFRQGKWAASPPTSCVSHNTCMLS